MVQMLRIVNLLQLVTCSHLVSNFLLDEGDDGAAVEDCRHQLYASDCLIPQTINLQPPHSSLLDVLNPIGDPVLDDLGPRVDRQLGLGVLLPLLTVFTLLSFFTVSTTMSSKR